MQNNNLNEKKNTTIVAVMTTKPKGKSQNQVKFIHDCKLQTVILDSLITVDIKDLKSYFGKADKKVIEQIDEKLNLIQIMK